MPVIIDGYNLIFQSKRLSGIVDGKGVEAAREGLLRVLNEWRGKKRRCWANLRAWPRPVNLVRTFCLCCLR